MCVYIRCLSVPFIDSKIYNPTSVNFTLQNKND
jgi:hypothetical protein